MDNGIAADTWPCRYCAHMKALNKPGRKFIGGCILRLHHETCDKFELAKCFEGHDPRQQS
jgi:hypothetical protein